MSKMSKLSLLRRHETELSNELNLVFQESTFDNHYSLNPRRLAELGSKLSMSLIQFVEGAELGSESIGRTLALEGVGEKTLARISSRIRRAVSALHGLDGESLNAVDTFVESLLIGFVRAREEHILRSQEEICHALAAALEVRNK